MRTANCKPVASRITSLAKDHNQKGISSPEILRNASIEVTEAQAALLSLQAPHALAQHTVCAGKLPANLWSSPLPAYSRLLAS